MLGQLAPIRVANVVSTAGDANSGVQTAAFNLPNDERIVREKGSKRVMLKNIQAAKFQHVLAPISTIALRPSEQVEVSFDEFFTHILMHELMHGLGPGTITVDGRETTIRQELRETHSTLEEAKANISGLWALHQLIDQVLSTSRWRAACIRRFWLRRFVLYDSGSTKPMAEVSLFNSIRCSALEQSR